MIKKLGKYFIFLGKLFVQRERPSVYYKLIIDEFIYIGWNSLFLVSMVSTFIGAVTCIQMAYNLISPMIPKDIIGLLVRDSTILELAPTITSIVLAGKVGSNIAGNIGTMRITEQVDALEVMGINSVSYLVLPKVISGILVFPMLVSLAGFLSILGGFVAGTLTGVVTDTQYISGLRQSFISFNVTFALIKSVVFAFLIVSISAYKGYQTRGGALEVGQTSTQAVTSSCIAVLVADYTLAKLLL